MREYAARSLILLFAPAVFAQTVPEGWQIIKDTKNLCQIAVPAEWSQYGAGNGAAVLKDTGVAMAVVTSQPQQAFAPLPAAVVRVLDIPKEKLFENSAKRIFYQDKTSKGPEDANSYNFAVPGKTGTCSGHLTFLPSVTEEVARKIAMSLGPATDGHTGVE